VELFGVLESGFFWIKPYLIDNNSNQANPTNFAMTRQNFLGHWQGHLPARNRNFSFAVW
jgi:hypothetical protein